MKSKPKVIVITGNPGVGKHTVAKNLAILLHPSKILDINKTALSNNAILGKDEFGIDIDTDRTGALISNTISKTEINLIIVGHLAPYTVNKNDIDMAAVLRRSPYLLVSTFKERGYSESKARENVASEIIGITLYDAIEKFGPSKVAEFDTTERKPDEIAALIRDTIENKLSHQAGVVDWLDLVSNKGDLERFLEY